MLQLVKKSAKLSTLFSCRYEFSVTFMQRQHEISPYDNLIRDIEAEDLKNQISVELNKKYLSAVSEEEKQVEQKRTGIFYGASRRGLMSIPTRHKNNNPIWIHYLIDPGSPGTYLTQEAIQALVGPSPQQIQALLVTINGKQIAAHKSCLNFKHVNILGMDYLICRKSLVYHAAGKESRVYLEIQF